MTDDMYRIAQLAEDDEAYPGARWALMSPVWVGAQVEVMAIKTATLRDAIRVAKSTVFLGCRMDAVRLHTSPPHGDPLTLAAAQEWIEHVADAVADGNMRAMADLGII